MDTGEALRAFCISDRELCRLNAERKNATKDAQANKQSARKILVDALLSMNCSSMSCQVDNQLYVVRIQENKPRVSLPPDVFDAIMREAWQERIEDFRAQLLEAESVVDAAVHFILTLRPKDEARREGRHAVQIRKTTAERLADDVPTAQPDMQEIVRVFMESGQRVADLSKDFNELRRSAAEERNVGEQQLVQQLQQLPSGSVPKVSITDSGGNIESFYLRLKAPRRRAPKKIQLTAFAKLLKRCLQREILRTNLTGRAAVDLLTDLDFGRSLREELMDSLACKDQAEALKDEKRVSVDKVRASRPSARRPRALTPSDGERSLQK